MGFRHHHGILQVCVLTATLLLTTQHNEVWAQATVIAWDDALSQPTAWYAGAEAVRIADNVLAYQDNSGGWPKNIDMAQVLRESEKAQIRKAQANLGAIPDNITIDNGATYTQMRYLARVYQGTGYTRFKTSFLRGVDYLLAAQYDNGGWPQFFPLRTGYYDQITFNDGAMIGVLELLRDIAAGKPEFAFVDATHLAKIEAALARGIESILAMQIRQHGKLTAWCAQHDKSTLEPAWARAYEPPSLSGGESVGIVHFLMSLDTPSPEIIAAIEGAIAWFEAVAIQDKRYERFIDESGKGDARIVAAPDAPTLWARFYELDSNRPIFLGRDSVIHYEMNKVEQERRNGYAYYGAWAADLLTESYPAWQAKQNASTSSQKP